MKADVCVQLTCRDGWPWRWWGSDGTSSCPARGLSFAKEVHGDCWLEIFPERNGPGLSPPLTEGIPMWRVWQIPGDCNNSSMVSKAFVPNLCSNCQIQEFAGSFMRSCLSGVMMVCRSHRPRFYGEICSHAWPYHTDSGSYSLVGMVLIWTCVFSVRISLRAGMYQGWSQKEPFSWVCPRYQFLHSRLCGGGTERQSSCSPDASRIYEAPEPRRQPPPTCFSPDGRSLLMQTITCRFSPESFTKYKYRSEAAGTLKARPRQEE